jgi:quercetin dioxygenase-like cupin family protein
MGSIRTVVRGIDSGGQSVFVSDDEVEGVVPPLLAGNEIFRLFGEEGVPTVPDRAIPEEGLGFFPESPGGYRFVIFTYPPDSQRLEPDNSDEALRETERLTPGMSGAVTDAARMHYTATVDLEYVLAGEFTLSLPNGEGKVLRAGDALIQCGAKHAWANNGAIPATMLLVHLGARLSPERFSAEE